MSHSIPPERAIPGNHIAVDGETAAKQQHPAVTPTPKTAVVLRAVRRCVASRAFRWGFVAVTVVLGGYAVAAQWGQVSRSLDRMGPLTVALALISVLLGALMSMQVWRALLASLGSPLPVPGTARILFFGQLGKYLPRLGVAGSRADGARQDVSGATSPLGQRVSARHAAITADRAAYRARHAALHRDVVLSVGLCRHAGTARLLASARAEHGVGCSGSLDSHRLSTR